MPKGFTLIELLVVIAIMAIVGTFAIANYRSFGQDKDLESAALDIQSLVKVAQTNATTNIKCQTKPVTTWRSYFFQGTDGQYKARLTCWYNDASGNPTGSHERYLILSSQIKIKTIDKDACLNALTNSLDEGSGNGSYAFVKFEPLSGKVDFISKYLGGVDGHSSGCNNDAQALRVILENTKTNSQKQVIIEKGGRVYVQ